MKLMSCNMLTHARMSDLAMPDLMKRKGRIVVVSSAAGELEIALQTFLGCNHNRHCHVKVTCLFDVFRERVLKNGEVPH